MDDFRNTFSYTTICSLHISTELLIARQTETVPENLKPFIDTVGRSDAFFLSVKRVREFFDAKQTNEPAVQQGTKCLRKPRTPTPFQHGTRPYVETNF